MSYNENKWTACVDWLLHMDQNLDTIAIKHNTAQSTVSYSLKKLRFPNKNTIELRTHQCSPTTTWFRNKGQLTLQEIAQMFKNAKVSIPSILKNKLMETHEQKQEPEQNKNHAPFRRCIKCNTAIIDKAKYCYNCGTKVISKKEQMLEICDHITKAFNLLPTEDNRKTPWLNEIKTLTDFIKEVADNG